MFAFFHSIFVKFMLHTVYSHCFDILLYRHFLFIIQLIDIRVLQFVYILSSPAINILVFWCLCVHLYLIFLGLRLLCLKICTRIYLFV